MMDPDQEALQIKRAEQAVLARAQEGAGSREQLVFDGHWHEAYPVALLEDRRLTDSARIHYLHLLRKLRGGICAMPTLHELSRDLQHSRATVVRDRLLLRLTGWISLRSTVRDARGRIRGQVYGVHSEALQHEGCLVHDIGYMAIVEQCQTHADARLRQVAKEAMSAILGGEDETLAESPTVADTATGDQSLFFEPGGQSSNSEPGEDQSSKFELSNEVIESKEKITRVQNLNSGVRSSSSSSSSSSSKNTTTTKTGKVKNLTAPPAADPGLDQLRWPKNFSDNDYRLARLKLTGVPPDRRQAVLDAYQYRLEQGQRIHTPIAYFSRLCSLARSGQLVPVPAQWQGQDARPGSHEDTSDLERRRIAGDIAALEQLLQAGPNPALEAQIAKLRQALSELEASATTPEPGDVT